MPVPSRHLLHHENRRSRAWYLGEQSDLKNFERRGHRKFNRFWGRVTLATLNVRSLGKDKQDADFYYSYLQSLHHDALALTEMWNSQERYDSWRCVTSMSSRGDDTCRNVYFTFGAVCLASITSWTFGDFGLLGAHTRTSMQFINYLHLPPPIFFQS